MFVRKVLFKVKVISLREIQGWTCEEGLGSAARPCEGVLVQVRPAGKGEPEAAPGWAQ